MITLSEIDFIRIIEVLRDKVPAKPTVQSLTPIRTIDQNGIYQIIYEYLNKTHVDWDGSRTGFVKTGFVLDIIEILENTEAILHVGRTQPGGDTLGLRIYKIK